MAGIRQTFAVTNPASKSIFPTFCKDVCLLDQLYIRDDKMTISDLIKGAAKTIGEPITVVRFVRIQLGAE